LTALRAHQVVLE